MSGTLEDLEAQPGFQNTDDERLKAEMIRAFEARLRLQPTNVMAQQRLAAIRGGQDIPPGVGQLPMPTADNEAMIGRLQTGLIPPNSTLQGAATGFGSLKSSLDALVEGIKSAHIPQTPAEQQYGMPPVPTVGQVGQALNTSVIPQPSPLQQQAIPPGAFAQAGEQTGIPGMGTVGQSVESAAAGAAQAATPASALAAGAFATPLGPALGQTLAPAIGADAMNQAAEAYGEGGVRGAVSSLAGLAGSMAPFLAGTARGLEGPRVRQGGLSIENVPPEKPAEPKQAAPPEQGYATPPEVRDAFNRGASTSVPAKPSDMGWDAGLSVKEVSPRDAAIARRQEAKDRLRPETPKAGLMVAYHGSPHDFTEFDPSKIGTGEGAQAFGYGIYVAQNPHVGNEYYKKLAEGKDQTVLHDGKETKVPDWVARSVKRGDNIDEIINDFSGRVKEGEANLATSSQPWNIENQLRNQRGILDAVTALKEKRGEIKRSGGVYHVDVPDSHLSDFLDLDKPLSEQPGMIDRLKEIQVPVSRAREVKQNSYGDKKFYLVDNKGEWGSQGYDTIEAAHQAEASRKTSVYDLFAGDKSNTGLDLVDTLNKNFGPDKASALLESVGIKGNKYLDHNSRDMERNSIVQMWDADGTYTEKRIPFSPESNTVKSFVDEQVAAGRRVEVKRPEGTRNLVLFPEYSKTVKLVGKGGPVSAFTPKPKVGLGIEHVGPDPINDYTEKVSNLNIGRMMVSDEIKQDIRTRADFIESQRRHVTFDEMQIAAEKLGFGLKEAEHTAKLLKTRGAAEFVASGEVAADMMVKRKAVLDEWKRVSETGTPAEIEAMAKKLDESTQLQLRGVAAAASIGSDLGRNLASQRIGRMPISTTKYQRVINELLERIKDKSLDGELPKPVLEMLRDVDLSDVNSMKKFVVSQAPRIATKGEKFYEFWVNGLLSNPTTHIRNTVGNLGAAVLMPFETMGSAVSGLQSKPLEKGQFFNRITTGETKFGEAPAQVRGAYMGLRAGAKSFVEGLRGWDAIDASKLDAYEGGNPLDRAPKIGGWFGKAVRTPSNFLIAADNMMKAVHTSSSLYKQGYRLAAKEGLTGKALTDRMVELADNPTVDMLEAAHHEARYRTFQNPLGEFGNKLLNLRSWELKWKDKGTGVRPLAYNMPFVSTPINLLKYSAERTPLQWLRMAKDGFEGKYKNDRAALEHEAGKAVVGSMIAAWVASEVLAGNQTGAGPSDPKQRKAMRDAGWSPYAHKVGKRWVPINAVDPASGSIMLVADTVEMWKAATGAERAKIPAMVIKSIMHNLDDKTYLSGLKSANRAFDDPERYFDQWSGRQVGSVIPSAVGGVARALDPFAREADGMLDQIKLRIPGVREQVKVVRDIRGNRVEAPGEGMFENEVGDKTFKFLSPILPTARRGGELEKLVAAAGASIPDVPDKIDITEPRVGPNGRKMPGTKHTLELDPEEQDVYANFRGKIVDRVFRSLEANKEHPFWTLAKSENENDRRSAADMVVGIVRQAGNSNKKGVTDAREQMLRWLAQQGRISAKLAEDEIRRAQASRNAFAVSVEPNPSE